MYPNTTKAVVKALIRAAMWLDENDNANRPEAVEILSRPEYVGADYDVIANSMTGTFEFEKGDKREVSQTSTCSSATTRPTHSTPTRSGI